MKQVFVFGAGFTRAFCPHSPLLTDAFGVEELLERFHGFPASLKLMQAEIRANKSSLINIERLMTRLDTLMPYDAGHVEEYRLLLSSLKLSLTNRIIASVDVTGSNPILRQLAHHCLRNGIDCVTFNYDEFLDSALCCLGRIEQNIRWYPDGGYGFYCKPAGSLLGRPSHFNKPPCRILKLHGSTNWRIIAGSARPYSITSIVHTGSWAKLAGMKSPDNTDLEGHLEPEPFLVPPVLNKAGLMQQPVLRTIWSLAKDALEKADCVSFVGYSFPETDLASRFLFEECVAGRNVKIEVVNFAIRTEDKMRLIKSYKGVFPEIEDSNFDFSGAEAWARRISNKTAA